jgi:hypothetical protein
MALCVFAPDLFARQIVHQDMEILWPDAAANVALC